MHFRAFIPSCLLSPSRTQAQRASWEPEQRAGPCRGERACLQLPGPRWGTRALQEGDRAEARGLAQESGAPRGTNRHNAYAPS